MTLPVQPEERLERLERFFLDALETLERSSSLSKRLNRNHVLELALRLLKEPGGPEVLYLYAPRFEPSGLFQGSDWAHAELLRPELVVHSMHQRGLTLALECMSELRLLAIANGNSAHPSLSKEEARAFLEGAIGFNLDLLFPASSEATRALRAETPELMDGVQRHFEMIIRDIGLGGILTRVLGEVERIVYQRPILVRRVKSILGSVSLTEAFGLDPELQSRVSVYLNAFEGPTELSREASSLFAYGETLATLDPDTLAQEAKAFGDAMWATGLVAPQHATLLRFLNTDAERTGLLALALGLEETGRAALGVHRVLVRDMIQVAIHPETAQSIYGLSNLLVSGLVFFSPVPPSLRRLALMRMAPHVATLLDAALRKEAPLHNLSPNAVLLSGALSVLGQPLGIGQGDNPTCQSARAMSLWAQGDPAYLLELLAQAAGDDCVTMHFEGAPIRSGDLPSGMAADLHTELDPVSLVLVPHLDRIYAEMGRRVNGRGDDGHRWINPEFHGWPVHRGFALAVDIANGTISRTGFDAFVRLFYAAYNPLYWGAAQLIHPQPVGIASTNHEGVFLGWHAVSIQRVFRDPYGRLRLYFYNPNNDGFQDWGQGIVTSTHGHGELAGESSLPFHEFAARLYLFHHNLLDTSAGDEVPPDEVATIADLAQSSWAAGYPWTD